MKIATVLASKGPLVVTTGPTTTITAAIQILAEHHIGAIVVVDGSPRPVGILAERDIIRALVQGPRCLTDRVSDLMTRDVVCGVPDDDVDAVLRTMTAQRFRHLPIVQDKDLVGIVTIGDLVKAEMKEFQGGIDTLETRLMNA